MALTFRTLAAKESIELPVPLLRSPTAPAAVMELSFADTIAVPLRDSVSEEPMTSNRSVPELAVAPLKPTRLHAPLTFFQIWPVTPALVRTSVPMYMLRSPGPEYRAITPASLPAAARFTKASTLTSAADTPLSVATDQLDAPPRGTSAFP